MKKIGFDGNNVGGLSRIYEIPESSIKKLEVEYLTGVNTLHLVSTENVLEIYFTPDTGGFEEENSKSNQGDKYTTKISGTIPKAANTHSNLIAYLTNGYHHFVFEDNNGQVRFKKNLSFKRVINVGTEISGMNGIKFEISGTHKEPSLYISESIFDSIK